MYRINLLVTFIVFIIILGCSSTQLDEPKIIGMWETLENFGENSKYINMTFHENGDISGAGENMNFGGTYKITDFERKYIEFDLHLKSIIQIFVFFFPGGKDFTYDFKKDLVTKEDVLVLKNIGQEALALKYGGIYVRPHTFDLEYNTSNKHPILGKWIRIECKITSGPNFVGGSTKEEVLIIIPRFLVEEDNYQKGKYDFEKYVILKDGQIISSSGTYNYKLTGSQLVIQYKREICTYRKS